MRQANIDRMFIFDINSGMSLERGSTVIKPHPLPETTPPDPTHKAQFADMLLKTFTSEAVFLLTTFANMARSCHGNEQEERQFISAIALEIFEVFYIMCG